MSVVAPPEPPRRDELEALIREARARQRRRLMLLTGAVAAVAAVGLSLWAAIPGRSGGDHATNGGRAGAASRGIEDAGRVPIVEVGTSGGVTWAVNGPGMWLTTNGGRTWRASAPLHIREMGDVVARVEQVDFLDRRHGWLLAVDVRGGLRPAWRRHAELDWTGDGGRTWHWTMPKGCCGDVSFPTQRRGYFLSPSATFTTIDGGSTWKRVSALPFSGARPPSSMLAAVSPSSAKASFSGRSTVAGSGRGSGFRTSLASRSFSWFFAGWGPSAFGSSSPPNAWVDPGRASSSTSAMTVGRPGPPGPWRAGGLRSSGRTTSVGSRQRAPASGSSPLAGS